MVTSTQMDYKKLSAKKINEEDYYYDGNVLSLVNQQLKEEEKLKDHTQKFQKVILENGFYYGTCTYNFRYKKYSFSKRVKFAFNEALTEGYITVTSKNFKKEIFYKK